MSRHERLEKPKYKMHPGEKEMLKRELYERSGGMCEHPEGCEEANIDKLTIDHFTPQAVARIWGWTPEEVNDPLNLLLLCRTHHDEKDMQTRKIKELNVLEYKQFKAWAIEQRAVVKQKVLEIQERLVA